MEATWIVRVIVLLGLASGFASAAPKADGNDLAALCRGESIKLESLSQLDELVTKLDDDPDRQCVPNTIPALRKLKSVVDDNKNQECSLESYGRYRDFYMEYLDTSDKKTRKENMAKLPKSLRKFAIAYGVQMSAWCRINMVEELLASDGKLVTSEDFETIGELIDPEGPIAQVIRFDTASPDKILVPSDMAAVFDESDDPNQKIPLNIHAVPYIKRIQTVCERRFKPIYEKLVLPVTKMANLGFDYRKAVLKEAIQEAEKKGNEKRGLLGRWSRVVFLCELLCQIELVEMPEDAKQAAGSDATQVSVLPKDQAATNQKRGTNLLEEASVSLSDIKQLEYEPALRRSIPDVILGTPGQKRAVKRVNTDRSEAANIRRNFLYNLVRQLVKNLSRYKFLPLFKDLYAHLRRTMAAIDESKKNNVPVAQSLKTQLIVLLNQMIDEQVNIDREVGSDTVWPEDRRYSKGVRIAAIILIPVIVVVVGFLVGAIFTGGFG